MAVPVRRGSRLGLGGDKTLPVAMDFVIRIKRYSSKNMETSLIFLMNVNDVARNRAISIGRPGKVLGSLRGIAKDVHGSTKGASLDVVVDSSVPRRANS